MYSDHNELSDALKPKSSGMSGNEVVPTVVNVPVYDEVYLFRLTNRALDIVIQSNHFEFKDSLSLRKVSRSLKGSVNKTPSFKTAAFYQVLRNVRATEFFETELVGSFSSLNRAIINKDKKGLELYLKEFFELMLNNLVGHPEIACRLVQISAEMELMPEDFKSLGDEVVTLFKFLTQPIKDSSEKHKNEILSCIIGLRENGYTESGCKNLEESINATFEFLRDRKFGRRLIYKNLSGVYFARENLERANLVGANLSHTNLEQASLNGAYLQGATLQGANLFRVTLIDAYLSRANLEGVNLSWAKLAGADFSRANLAGADFTYAYLIGNGFQKSKFGFFNCSQANLVEANLAGADFTYAMFCDARGFGNGMLTSVFYLRAYLFTKATIVDFINNIEKAVRLNPTGILPLLFAISEEKLSEIDANSIVKLKDLSQACLNRVITKAESVETLWSVLLKVCDEEKIFRYSPPELKNDVKDLYQEILPLIADTYLSRKLSCESPQTENEFRTKLIEEICKQKRVFGFFNEAWNGKWNDLLDKIIKKTQLKSGQPLPPQSRGHQM